MQNPGVGGGAGRGQARGIVADVENGHHLPGSQAV